MAGSSYVDKALYTTTNTFGILRKELIESLGLEYAKFFYSVMAGISVLLMPKKLIIYHSH